MNRYGSDYRQGWGSRYDPDHRHWGSDPRYDREFGIRVQPRGYDRGSGYQGRPSFDRERSFRGGSPGYDRNFGFGNRSRGYDRDFQRYGQRDFGPSGGWDRGGRFRDRGYQGYGGGGDRGGREWTRNEMDLMSRRQPISPWAPHVPGQDFGYSLGHGIGGGQYIHK